MLSKVLIIVLSFLFIIVAVAAQSNLPDGSSLASMFIPNMGKIDVTGAAIFVLVGFIFMILGILFSKSGSGSGGSSDNLLNFLKGGMNPNLINSLDNTSKQVLDFFDKLLQEKISIAEARTQQVQMQLQQSQKTIENLSSQKQEVKPQKKEEMPSFGGGNFESMNPSNKANNNFNFDANRTKDQENKEAFGSPNLLDEADDGQFGPSDFSDFSEDGDSSKGAATVIASIPEELLRQTKKNYMGNNNNSAVEINESDEFKKVFKEYYALKQKCGESVIGLTEQSFIKKLETTQESVIQKNNCKKVEFSVYEKDGKAALKATPKF